MLAAASTQPSITAQDAEQLRQPPEQPRKMKHCLLQDGGAPASLLAAFKDYEEGVNGVDYADISSIYGAWPDMNQRTFSCTRSDACAVQTTGPPR